MEVNAEVDRDEDFNVYNRTRTCPDCGSHSLKRSTNCLSEALGDVDESNNTSGISGKLCTANGCDWFKLDRSENCDESETPTQGEKKLKYGNKELSILRNDVELNGSTAKLTIEDGCPECSSNLIVTFARRTPGEDGVNEEEYIPIREKCTNFGRTGDACAHRE